MGRQAAALGLCGVLLAACGGGSTPKGIQLTPIKVGALRTITMCPARVRVPAAVSFVVPSATLAPTESVQAGDAVAFSSQLGRYIGFGGTQDPGESALLCVAAPSEANRGRTVLVARRPGYARVAIRATPKSKAKLVLIKITS
jgi:hypothetical protein